MQPNTITLQVDELNNATLVDNVYTRFEEFQNRASYISGDHSMSAKDTLGLYRTFPKPSGNFRGVIKTSVKFSKDLAVTGVDGVSTLTAPVIVELSFSVPVGATAADVLIARQRALAILDRDDIMVSLNEQAMV